MIVPFLSIRFARLLTAFESQEEDRTSNDVLSYCGISHSNFCLETSIASQSVNSEDLHVTWNQEQLNLLNYVNSTGFKTDINRRNIIPLDGDGDGRTILHATGSAMLTTANQSSCIFLASRLTHA